jgi:hypothetical protein
VAGPGWGAGLADNSGEERGEGSERPAQKEHKAKMLELRIAEEEG